MSTRKIPRSLSVALTLSSLLVTYAAEETLTYSYDPSLRLTAVNTSAGKRIEYVYDASGNVVGRTIRNFVDSDVDGLDDAWEQTNFGNLSGDGRGDFDSDGALDIAEFLAETNPKDAASVLKITRLNSPAQLEWRSQAGVRYRVQYTDSLTTPAWRQVGDDVVASGALSQLSDPAGTTNRERYYRIVAVR
jgi:YD repeat-containing protein